MLYIDDMKAALPLFSALDSEIRLRIVGLLLKNKNMNLNEIAKELGISNAAITVHMRKLEAGGIVKVEAASGIRGTQKVCCLNEDTIVIKLCTEEPLKNAYTVDINVGYYSDYKIAPTCGLASWTHIIGEVDNPRYFADPERIGAEILWLHKGFVEYRIPNYLKPDQAATELQISMEIGSEAPGYCEDWPSDISFYFNGSLLGSWISPGDYGEKRGLLNPPWWPNINQYGLLKMLSINKNGTFLDGVKLSGVTLRDLQLNRRNDFVFRLSVDENAKNIGGLTLYGQNFGNYNQGIRARILFESVKTATQNEPI